MWRRTIIKLLAYLAIFALALAFGAIYGLGRAVLGPLGLALIILVPLAIWAVVRARRRIGREVQASEYQRRINIWRVGLAISIMLLAVIGFRTVMFPAQPGPYDIVDHRPLPRWDDLTSDEVRIEYDEHTTKWTVQCYPGNSIRWVASFETAATVAKACTR